MLTVDVRGVIKRPPMEVFKAWTDPECIAHWIMPGGEKGRVHIEPRAGGAFTIELKKPHWKLEGEILEVVPGKLLRFRWITPDVPRDVNSIVSVHFAAAPDGATDLHLVHEGFPDEKVRAEHDGPGWQQIVDVFVRAENMSAEALRVAAASA